MNRILAVSLICILGFTAGCGALSPGNSRNNVQSPAAEQPKVEQPKVEQPKVEQPKVESPGVNQPQGQTQVKVFLIALDDNGKNGKKLDTGDSLVGVTRTIPNKGTPLRGALEQLLSIKDRIYGQSGLYNSLYASDLKLDSVSVQNGIALINLSGKLSLGGVMDNPRFKAQIIETALQFPTVKSVLVNINNRPIDDVLSMK